MTKRYNEYTPNDLAKLRATGPKGEAEYQRLRAEHEQGAPFKNPEYVFAQNKLMAAAARALGRSWDGTTQQGDEIINALNATPLERINDKRAFAECLYYEKRRQELTPDSPTAA